MAKKKMTFAGAISKAPKKVWEEARKAEPGGADFSLPEIEDGVYPCKATKAKADTDKDGNPYFTCKLKVLEGEYEGTVLDKFHSIKDFEKDLPRLVKTLKGMGYELPENQDPGSLIDEIVTDINANEPEVMVAVENDTYEAKKDGKDYKKGDTLKTLNVYVNRPRSLEEGAGDKSKPAKKDTKKAPVAKKSARK